MPANFPDSPTVNQTYTYGTTTWRYTGQFWQVTDQTTVATLSAVTSNIVPASNIVYDLGSTTLRWRDLYLSGNTIDLGGTAIKSSAAGISFSNSANAQQTVALTVSSLQIVSATGNVVTLQATATGLQTVGTTGNVVATTPGGSSSHVQYNLDGAFAGSSNLTFSGTTLTMAANPVLSAGTANGIVYLNGSKAATTGSALTFDGTNLGIGTSSPTAQLQLNKTGTSDYTTFRLSNSGASGKTYEIGVGGNASAAGYANNLYFYDSTAGANRMVIDSSGNLGLGVTPSAWRSLNRALQIGSVTSLVNIDATASSGFDLGSNLYFDSGSTPRYLITGAPATFYRQQAGGHYWFTAPSGTAGNAITFTQAMTLDASSNLGVGTTSPATRLHATQTSNGATVRPLMVDNGGNSGTCVAGISFANGGIVKSSINAAVLDNDFMTFCVGGSGNTERVRITSGGNLGIGTTSPDCKLQVEAADGATGGAIRYTATGVCSGYMSADPNGLCLATDTAGITFRTGVSGNDPTDTGIERAKIDVNGKTSFWGRTDVHGQVNRINSNQFEAGHITRYSTTASTSRILRYNTWYWGAASYKLEIWTWNYTSFQNYGEFILYGHTNGANPGVGVYTVHNNGAPVPYFGSIIFQDTGTTTNSGNNSQGYAELFLDASAYWRYAIRITSGGNEIYPISEFSWTTNVVWVYPNDSA